MFLLATEGEWMWYATREGFKFAGSLSLSGSKRRLVVPDVTMVNNHLE